MHARCRAPWPPGHVGRRSQDPGQARTEQPGLEVAVIDRLRKCRQTWATAHDIGYRYLGKRLRNSCMIVFPIPHRQPEIVAEDFLKAHRENAFVEIDKGAVPGEKGPGIVDHWPVTSAHILVQQGLLR